MLFRIVLSTLFSGVLGAAPHPNLFEVRRCALEVNGTEITFENSFVRETVDGDTFYFSACRDLRQVGCDTNALGCVKRKDGRIINLPNVRGVPESFVLGNGGNCSNGTYEVEVQMSSVTDKYKVEKQNECKYTLKINREFTEYCSQTVDDRKLFFMGLPDDISIESGDETITFNLCRAPAGCKNGGVAVCSRNETTKAISHLGLISTKHVSDSKGHIEFHYKTVAPKRRDEKVTSIILKCNWTTTLSENRIFRRLSSKKTEIVVETSLACTKRVRSCQFLDSDNYLRNLTGLFRPDGWNLKAVGRDDGPTVKLNVCGPLNSDGPCADQRSQVCRSDGGPLSYGSAMSSVSVENEVVKFSVNDGSQCRRNPAVNLMTRFELHCSFEEEGPTLAVENDCGLEVAWRTPLACPISSNASRYKITKENRTKLCTVEDGDFLYDLTQLSSEINNHVVKYNELDFLLNVCRPIVDTNDSLCQGMMGMCLRNNSEPNIKKKFFNIGGVQNPTVQNGQLVLRYAHGFLCKKNMKDASAIIYFNCSERESNVTFLRETECVYEFNWATKYACPSKIECVLRDNLNNIIYLANVKTTTFQFKSDETTYNIDICKDQFTITDSGGRKRDVKVVKNVFNDIIEYGLDRKCNQANDFNIIQISLDCDVLLNNDHFEFGNISDCKVHLKLRHNSFCRAVPDITVRTVEEKLPKNYYDTPKYAGDEIKKCVVPYNDRAIDLNDLKPVRVRSSEKKRYTIGMNKTARCRHFICYENRPVATLNDCPKVTAQNDRLKLTFNGTDGGSSYLSEVVFYCKTEEALPEVVSEEWNSVSFRYPLDSLCYETSGGSGSLIAGIVSCIFIIFLCGLGLYNKRLLMNKCNKGRKSRTYVYCRNSDN